MFYSSSCQEKFQQHLYFTIATADPINPKHKFWSLTQKNKNVIKLLHTNVHEPIHTTQCTVFQRSLFHPVNQEPSTHLHL